MDWLSKEIKKIKTEEKYFLEHPLERKARDKILFRRWLLALVAFFLLGVTSDCLGHISSKQIVVEWICPDCGYDNCEGIRYCPLCGSEQ